MWLNVVLPIWFFGMVITFVIQMAIDAPFKVRNFQVIIRRLLFWFIYIPAILIDFEMDK
jgi:hypothetical protein